MTTTYKGTPVYYSETGQGPVLVLLHGFLEDSSMWNPFIPTLSLRYRVVCIDLLGQGSSGTRDRIHTMQDMAAAVNVVLIKLDLAQITLIGHSMGGYVCCAFAKAYPEKVIGICLLNSTPKADSPERKKIRIRANIMARENYEQLVQMSFINLFNSTTRNAHKQAISHGLSVALRTSVKGYIAANTGMMQRDDYTTFWKEAIFKKGMILGQEDWIVDSSYHTTHFQNDLDFFKILPGGHMSHIGQAQETIQNLLNFLNT